jgi:ABC-type transport system substrate-binding protein
LFFSEKDHLNILNAILIFLQLFFAMHATSLTITMARHIVHEKPAVANKYVQISMAVGELIAILLSSFSGSKFSLSYLFLINSIVMFIAVVLSVFLSKGTRKINFTQPKLALELPNAAKEILVSKNPHFLPVLITSSLTWLVVAVFHIEEFPFLLQVLGATDLEVAFVSVTSILAFTLTMIFLPASGNRKYLSIQMLFSSAFMIILCALFFVCTNIKYAFITLVLFGFANGCFVLSQSGLIQLEENFVYRVKFIFWNRMATSIGQLQTLLLLPALAVVVGQFRSALALSIISTAISSALLYKYGKKIVSTIIVFAMISKFSFPAFADGSKDKIISVAVRGLPVDTDPTRIVDVSSAFVLGQVFENLYEYAGSNILEPRLAQSHTIGALGKIIKVKLRSDIRFSDGTLLSAEIARTSLLRTLRVLGEEARWSFGNIVGFDEFVRGNKNLPGLVATENNELIFKLNQPFAQFLNILAAPYYSITKLAANGTDFLGTGTFRIQSKESSQWILDRWRSDSEQAPASIRFILTKLNEHVDEQNALKNGIDILDIYHEVIPPKTHTLIEYDYLQAVTLMFNTERKIFKKAADRCAFADAFQAATAQTGYMLRPMSTAAPFATFLEGSAYGEKEIKINPSSSLAREPVEVLYSNGVSAFSPQTIGKIAKNLSKSNISATFLPTKYSTLFKSATLGNFDALIMAYVPDYLDVDAFLYPFFYTKQQYNWSRYTNQTVDALLDISRKIQDKEARYQVQEEVFNVMSRDCPVRFLGTQKGLILARNSLTLPKISGLGIHTLKLRGVKFR